MGKVVEKLTDLQVRRLAKPGRYGDGGLLVLNIGPSGTKSWLLRYRNRATGKITEVGLGSIGDVSLKRARERAAEARAMLAEGRDPLREKRRTKAAAALEAASTASFGACVQRYADSLGSAWRSPRHRKQWVGSLTKYAKPLMSLPVALVDVAAVLNVVEPLWLSSHVTATKIRQRISATLDYATARGYRTGENPARWRGHLDKLLPKTAKLHKVKHLAALHYSKLPALIQKIRETDSTVARLLEFVILTACRVSEASNASWLEIDYVSSVWTIPGARIKAGKEHRVPLSTDALAVLDKIPGTGGLIFWRSGPTGPRPLYTSAPLNLLNGPLACPGVTVHGFRSAFRCWGAEQTEFPRELAEMSLAHAVKGAVEAAYQRSDLLERRRELMQAWGDFLRSGQ
ncbi:MAG: integrase arm-type DNA-binding domain-containing protein [Rhodanobacteraceae bacterium]|nr:integrase arm-type DNA-binding domain-containing protein [Rhodanobacteraceae bacterium]